MFALVNLEPKTLRDDAYASLAFRAINKNVAGFKLRGRELFEQFGANCASLDALKTCKKFAELLFLPRFQVFVFVDRRLPFALPSIARA